MPPGRDAGPALGGGGWRRLQTLLAFNE